MTWEDVQYKSTEDLIMFIQYKEQDDFIELAEASFVAFTFRFRNEVIDKCRKVGKKWDYDNGTADIIAERAFERFWKYPHGFQVDRCGQLTIDKCVLFYLFRIAGNCFFDYAKELSGENLSPYDGTEAVIVEFPSLENLDIPEDRLSDLKELHDSMEKALASLSPKHKIIYLTYKAYEKEGFKLPRTLLRKLREELNLTQNSIRVYKNETFQTVNQHLSSHDSE